MDGAGDDNSDIFQDPELWFFDGNIILLSANGTGFKIHKSILDRKVGEYSGRFDDGSMNFERKLEGVDVMDMTAYRAADVRTLVTCLYNEPYV